MALVKEIWIVKGSVTDPEAHNNQAEVGAVEWQFSDGPPGERDSSVDFTDLEEGLRCYSGHILHWCSDNDEAPWVDKHDIRQLDSVCYPQVSYGPNGDMDITHEQATSLFRKWKQSQTGARNNMSWKEFAASIQPTFGMDGAIIVRWSGMWLAIETDGYTHS